MSERRKAGYLLHSESQAQASTNRNLFPELSILVVNASMKPERVREITGVSAECILLPYYCTHTLPWWPENAFMKEFAAAFTSNRNNFYPGATSNPMGFREAFESGTDPVTALEFRPSAQLAQKMAEEIAKRVVPFGNRLYLDDSFANAPGYHIGYSSPYWNNDEELFCAWWRAYVEMLVRLLYMRHEIHVWCNCAHSLPEYATSACIESATSHMEAIESFQRANSENSIYWFGDPPLDIPGLCVPGVRLEG